jgi:Exocyst complex component Sec3
MFDGLQTELLGFIEYGTRGDPTQSLSMLVAIESQAESCEGSDQEFGINMLDFLGARLEKVFENFIVSHSSVSFSCMCTWFSFSCDFRRTNCGLSKKQRLHPRSVVAYYPLFALSR